MRTRTHRAVARQRYLTAFGLNPDRVIFFDIETTGFRASTSSLYMIGWAVSASSVCAGNASIYPDAGLNSSVPQNPGIEHSPDDMQDAEWIVTQILADSRREEILVLERFAHVLEQYDTIIAFNGDRFDLPYMREKYEAYGMPDPFAYLETVDLYRLIRPFGPILGLTKLNQKSVEQFLQIHREDLCSGGELIDVYRSVRDHCCADEKGALDALFLHNYEDVLGMLDMTELLSYPLALRNTSPVSVRSLTKTGQEVLEASFLLEVPVPGSLRCSLEDCCDITLCGAQAIVTIRPHTGSLYHFFADYKNYYYLPEEDTAIHKSVASFVNPSHREKATARTCYVKKSGTFLPAAGEDGPDVPLFARCYKDSILWFEYHAEMAEDPAALANYIHGLVRTLLAGSRNR